MIEYVIRRGRKIIFQNREGYSKEELKAIRDRMAAEAGLSHFTALAGAADDDTRRELCQKINQLVHAGHLPHVSRR